MLPNENSENHFVCIVVSSLVIKLIPQNSWKSIFFSLDMTVFLKAHKDDITGLGYFSKGWNAYPIHANLRFHPNSTCLPVLLGNLIYLQVTVMAPALHNYEHTIAVRILSHEIHVLILIYQTQTMMITHQIPKSVIHTSIHTSPLTHEIHYSNTYPSDPYSWTKYSQESTTIVFGPFKCLSLS